jgi:hypothetical protein
VNTCITCELPETRWDPTDPLYLESGSQCPDCNRADLDEEAAREHAEVTG